MTTTIDSSALPVARAAIARMSMQEKAQLLVELAQAVAAAAASTSAMEGANALTDLDRLISDAAKAGPAAADSADVLAELRR